MLTKIGVIDIDKKNHLYKLSLLGKLTIVVLEYAEKQMSDRCVCLGSIPITATKFLNNLEDLMSSKKFNHRTGRRVIALAAIQHGGSGPHKDRREKRMNNPKNSEYFQEKYILPADYEECGYCGFDHEYEPQAAAEWHKENDPDNEIYK